MKYQDVISAVFINRENRFIATVKTEKGIERVHVKNTGRCRELLVKGATVYLEKGREGRKTPYDLVAVEKKTEKGTLLINMDSQAPNIMVGEWLKGGLFSKDAKLRAEYTYGDSRIDFFVIEGNKKALVEVKGVTLENDGVARFPDAPTERGKKHLRELIKAKKEGYESYVLFVIQLCEVSRFEPNIDTDPEFARLLCECRNNGVNILAFKSCITPEEAYITDPVSVFL